MQKVHSQFRSDHPLVQMIKRCLKSFPEDRPSVHQVVQLLERARGEIDDAECHMDRLMLVSTVKELSSNALCMEQEIELKEQELLCKKHEIEATIKNNSKLVEEKIELMQQNKELMERVHFQMAQMEQLRKQLTVSNEIYIFA